MSGDVLKYITVRRTSDRQISTKTDEKSTKFHEFFQEIQKLLKKVLDIQNQIW